MKNQLTWFKTLPAGLALRLISLSLIRKIFKIPVTFSYSQGAEDLILSYFQLATPGIYVDVGCNEPIRFSNTFGLYLQGWRGVIIDANSSLIDKCKKIRKKDISICAAVSDTKREATFHKSTTSAVSTIDEDRLKIWEKVWTFDKESKEKVVTRTLTSILDENLPSDSKVDLLTIDVEGHDFNVLKGLDLTKYRPKVIIIETHSLDKICDMAVYKYLSAHGYSLKYYAVLNAYFVDNNSK
jgi:FkbM family methyltransferase